MQRRLIDLDARKARREELVALAVNYFNDIGHWQHAIEAAARKARISPTTLARTLRISRKLGPSILKMFDRGQIGIQLADRLTRLPKGEQLNALPALLPIKPRTMVVDISRYADRI
jgi:hypothetical protein